MSAQSTRQRAGNDRRLHCGGGGRAFTPCTRGDLFPGRANAVELERLRIDALLAVLNWDRTDLAQASGINKSDIAAYLRGRRPLSTRQYERLLRAIGTALPALADER